MDVCNVLDDSTAAVDGRPLEVVVVCVQRPVALVREVRLRAQDFIVPSLVEKQLADVFNRPGMRD